MAKGCRPLNPFNSPTAIHFKLLTFSTTALLFIHRHY